MIELKYLFEVCCDGCCEVLEIDGINAWYEQDDALTALQHCHWHIDSAGIVKCPLCMALEEL